MSETLPVIRRSAGLRASKIVAEPHAYLEANSEGATRLIPDLRKEEVRPDCSYRQIHDRHPATHPDPASEDLYSDPDYSIDIETDFPRNQVTLRRLSTCYGVTNRPAFIDPILDPTRSTHAHEIHCLAELPLYDLFHYRSLFITQDFNALGRYELVLNINGRFERVVVDDRIPVYRDTLEPIWGLSYQKPWELILFKAYAKVKNGYARAREAKPFEFVETVTNSPWKYFNLAKESARFIMKYGENKAFSRGKIIFKTKDSPEVTQAGLVRNSAGYCLLNIDYKNQEKAILTLRGTAGQNWSGEYSLLDSKCCELFSQLQKQENSGVQLTLERDFSISHSDALNLFSSAYVSSLRKGQYFTGYKLLEIAEEERKAQYLEFEFPSQGFIDISIRQFPENALKAGTRSSIALSNIHEGGAFRYVKTKHIIVKDKHFKDPYSSLGLEGEGEKGKEGGMEKSNIRGGNVYADTRFGIFEIDYMKGYNKCDAFFLALEKGKYILRFKSEHIPAPARYAISWVASSQINIQESFLSAEDKIQLLHDAVVSKMHRIDHFYLTKEHREMLCKADTFEELGYGFVAAKTTKDCDTDFLIRVDPKQLEQEGYALKGKWKEEKLPFEIPVKPLSYESVVLKKRRGATRYVPLNDCKGINFYRKRVTAVLSQPPNPIQEVHEEE